MLKNTDNISLSVSIIASDLSRTGYDVKDFDKNIIDYLHMDVMDGHFVPNLTFGPGYIKNLMNNTDIPLDVHLMIEKPEDSIDEYIKSKPWGITIHYESTRFPVRLLKIIRDAGIKSGLSINPSTPVNAIADLLIYTDLVLIMSVDPGFYGQKFLEISIGKIEQLNSLKQKNDSGNPIIQIDGGINRENISEVVKAGASMVVAGSAVFKEGNVNKNVMELKKIANSGI